MHYEGTRWWKFDFHTHTPESFDYGREDTSLRVTTTPRQWLMRYVEAGIECLAVTDHNGCGWIDRLKTEAQSLRDEGRNIYIFPGIEISASGNIHILGIFDIECGAEHVSNMFGKCDFQGTYGHTDGVCEAAPEGVIRNIIERNGVAIPAHIDKGAGICQLRGPSFSQALSKASAVEVINRDEPTDPNSPNPLKTYRSLKLNLTEVLGSDSHHPRDVGFSYTWVKMDKPSIEGLRLALLDGDSSVLRGDEHPENPNIYPPHYIKSINVGDTKYCGRSKPLELPFHPWLNTVVGGRGSGKSSILEFLRLGTGRDDEVLNLPSGSEVKNAFEKFARVPSKGNGSGVLLNETSICVEYFKDNQLYKLDRNYLISDSVCISRYDNVSGEWVDEEGEVKERFPVRIFSQKQIFDISRHPNSLLKIIDESAFVDKYGHDVKFAEAKSKFLKARSFKRDLEAKISQKSIINGRLLDVNRKINIFEERGHKKVLSDFQEARNKKAVIEDFERKTECFIDLIKNSYNKIEFPSLDGIKDADDVFEEKSQRILHEFYGLGNEINSLIKKGEALKKKFSDEFESSELKASLDNNFLAYSSLVEDLTSQGVENANSYEDLISKKKSLENELKEINLIETEIKSVDNEIADYYREMVFSRKSLLEKRDLLISEITSSNSFIKIVLLPFGEISSSDESFREAIGRTDDAFASDILMDDGEARSGILHYLALDLANSKDLNESFKKISSFKKNTINRSGQKVEGQQISKRFNDYLAKINDQMCDNFLAWFPEDSLKVSFSSDGKKFKDLSQGSAGQKSAAILSFLLSYGDEPLILDQPEDDLDNYLIYSMIVKKIKENKTKRQVVVVTHNPNIVVNGDSELVIALHEAGGQINVQSMGSLQENNVRNSVCDIMEGGRHALEQRYKRIVNI